jgi:hypothetical protein
MGRGPYSQTPSLQGSRASSKINLYYINKLPSSELVDTLAQLGDLAAQRRLAPTIFRPSYATRSKRGSWPP